MQCEVFRSAGYDPTGEWGVECGADGEFCPVCEMVVCAHCHKELSTDANHLLKKSPQSTTIANNRQKAG